MRALLGGMAVFALTTLADGPAHAVIGALDHVPASTLLIPRFEVDTASPTGRTTLVAYHNAIPNALLTNVTVWSELGVPVFHFLVYLTGYDMVTFDMRDVLAGNVPNTASAGTDPDDTISPKGPTSQDINYAACRGVLPYATLDTANAVTYLTGKAVAAKCAGLDHGDAIARGYLTIDTVVSCDVTVPSDGLGYARNLALALNGLAGDFFIIDGNETFSSPAVHLESGVNHPDVSAPGRYTFYGRYNNWQAADRLEPVGTHWWLDYENAGSRVLSWRDTKNANPAAFACATKPAFYPLPAAKIWAWDTEENVTEITNVPPFFLAASSSTALGGSGLPLVARRGTMYVTTNGAVPGSTGPSTRPLAVQSWMASFVRPEAFGSDVPFATAIEAVLMNSATNARTANGITYPDDPTSGP